MKSNWSEAFSLVILGLKFAGGIIVILLIFITLVYLTVSWDAAKERKLELENKRITLKSILTQMHTTKVSLARGSAFHLREIASRRSGSLVFLC